MATLTVQLRQAIIILLFHESVGTVFSHSLSMFGILVYFVEIIAKNKYRKYESDQKCGYKKIYYIYYFML